MVFNQIELMAVLKVVFREVFQTLSLIWIFTEILVVVHAALSLGPELIAACADKD